jgi:chromosome transmission fidelity protein 18
MAATGVRFEKSRVEQEHRGASGGWVYRMEPALDSLAAFETMKEAKEGVRYAVRQVLEQEWRKENLKRGEEARKRRMGGVDDEEVEDRGKDKKNELRAKEKGVKRDFFGRVVKTLAPTTGTGDDAEAAGGSKQKPVQAEKVEGGRVWVSFREGYSNAVRKPVTLKELMDGL